MKYIHYGSTKFDPTKFKRVKNTESLGIKPHYSTGLWASPINSEDGWYNWCMEEGFNVDRLDKSFTFSLTKDARIFTIDSQVDLKLLHTRGLAGLRWFNFYLDFNKLRDVYDVLHLTNEGQWNTRMTTTYSLYGWDCECILVMNNVIA